MPPDHRKTGKGASRAEADGPPGAPAAGRCPVCSWELADRRCGHCEASARVQEAHLAVSDVQSRGIRVEKSASLLQRARELLEENDIPAMDDYLQMALEAASEAETLQGPLRKALDKAAGAQKALKASGKDTRRLEQALSRAERFLDEGELEGARLLVRRIPAFIREHQGPPVPGARAPAIPRYLSTCPGCSRNIMRAWKKCPFCLKPLDAAGAA